MVLLSLILCISHAVSLPWPVSEHAKEQASVFSVHHFPGNDFRLMLNECVAVSRAGSDHFQCFDHILSGQSHSPENFPEIIGSDGGCSFCSPLWIAVYEVTTALAERSARAVVSTERVERGENACTVISCLLGSTGPCSSRGSAWAGWSDGKRSPQMRR